MAAGRWRVKPAPLLSGGDGDSGHAYTDIEYQADGARLVGRYVVDDGKPGKRPVGLRPQGDHGLPFRPRHRAAQDAANIKGKVLVCIGADDPIIPPEQRADFEKEMKAARVDWRLQLYGGAGHSFTNPAADSRGMKGFFYHEATDRRSWNAMIELFDETLK